MKKQEIMEIAAKYGMDWMVENAVTNQKIGVYCKSEDLIPELDELVGKDITPCVANRVNNGIEYIYNIYCPSNWMDLWGWC